MNNITPQVSWEVRTVVTKEPGSVLTYNDEYPGTNTLSDILNSLTRVTAAYGQVVMGEIKRRKVETNNIIDPKKEAANSGKTVVYGPHGEVLITKGETK